MLGRRISQKQEPFQVVVDSELSQHNLLIEMEADLALPTVERQGNRPLQN
jgi:hypothetical protein